MMRLSTVALLVVSTAWCVRAGAQPAPPPSELSRILDAPSDPVPARNNFV